MTAAWHQLHHLLQVESHVMYADVTLENAALKDVIARKLYGRDED